jgi:curved DNA-binding protein CbpA
LGKTPLPQLLVYVLERQLHGTLQLRAPFGETATIFVVRGFPAKAKVKDPIGRLGELLAYEGLMGEEGLARAQVRFEEQIAAGNPKLAGQIYLEMGLLDEATLRIGLGRQITQKIEHLFNWPPETTFAYFDGVDLLADYGPAPVTMIDPLPLVWSSVRDFPSWDHVNVALTRLGGNAVKLAERAVVERLDLAPAESDLVSDLRTRAMRLGDLTTNPHVTPSVGQLLLYCLLITKQLQMVTATDDGEEEVPAAPSSSTLPVANSTMATSAAASSMPGAMTPIPSTQSSPGTQVARVQLAKSKSTTGLPRAAVEEHHAPIVRIDGRIATPMPGRLGAVSSQHNPLVPAYTPSQTAASSPPPPMPAGGMTPIPSSIRSPPPSSAPAAPSSHSLSAPPPSGRGSKPPSVPSSGRISAPPTPASAPGSVGSFNRLSSPPAAPSSRSMIPPSSGSSAPGPASKPPLTPEQAAVRQRILDKAASIGSSNYFEILGIGQTATGEEVQAAFVSLAKIWHPDRLPAVLSDVRSECSRVFSYIGEAHATLIEPKRRADYMHLLREGGATPDDQEKMAILLGAATDFQKAEHFLKRGDNKKAEELVKKAMAADPDQPEYLAALAWLESMKPENQDEDSTMRRVAMLTEALKKNPKFEKAVYYRAMLWKRLGKEREAMNDFRLSVDLNPRNIDSAREIRLHNMRRDSKSPGGRNSTKPPPPAAAQLFGKLFKK